VIRANRPSAGSADSDEDGVPDKAQAKIDAAEAKDRAAVAGFAGKENKFSTSFGNVGFGEKPPEDDFKSDAITDVAVKLKSSKKFEGASPQERTNAARQAFDKAEADAVAGKKYVRDGAGYRPATPEDKGARDFGSIPFSPWKIQERNRLWKEEWAGQQARARQAGAKQAIPTK